MKNDISPITLTIQDFIGAVLPGMVWAVEFFTFKEIVDALPKGISSNVDKLMYPSTFDVALKLATDEKPVLYVGFVVCLLSLDTYRMHFPLNCRKSFLPKYIG
ncbi:MAG TPA: hypothetical protein VIK40_07775 [Geomonas sp.]